jgi:predicted ATPase
MSKYKGLFAEEFYYLNAERIGPRNYQLIDSKVMNNCGVYGENTVHLLNVLSVSNERVEPNKCYNFDEEKKVNTVSKQVEYWMDYIIPGIEISTDDITDLRVSKMMLQQSSLDTGFLSPYNFGFGISYVLPIILTGLIAKEGSMLLVENPEAHLHPKGQSHIGYFLAMMAMAGVQVVIETHSEHVINGIRIAALKNGMNPDDISINFFSIKEHDGIVKHMVEHITLNERMDLEVWPEGFMDQEEEDLRTLRELRRK